MLAVENVEMSPASKRVLSAARVARSPVLMAMSEAWTRERSVCIAMVRDATTSTASVRTSVRSVLRISKSRLSTSTDRSDRARRRSSASMVTKPALALTRS